MLAKLITLGSAFSLALALFFGVLWVRTQWLSEGVKWGDQYDFVWLQSSGGEFVFLRFTKDYVRPGSQSMFEPGFGYTKNQPRQKGPLATLHRMPAKDVKNNFSKFGLSVYRWVASGTEPQPFYFTHCIVAFPLWWLICAFMIFPFVGAVRWTIRRPSRIAQRRINAGLCKRCRYDLRCSNDICPECGTQITPS